MYAACVSFAYVICAGVTIVARYGRGDAKTCLAYPQRSTWVLAFALRAILTVHCGAHPCPRIACDADTVRWYIVFWAAHGQRGVWCAEP